MIRLIGVLAQVDVDPNSDGMPGADLIQKLLNWSQMLALWGSLGALLIGAAMYGLAREGGSYGGASRGKALAMGGVVINDKVLMPGETQDEKVSFLLPALREREPEIDPKDADVLDRVMRVHV